MQLGVASGALQNAGLYRNTSPNYPYNIASAINIIALFKPIENNSSTFSNFADLFSHFK